MDVVLEPAPGYPDSLRARRDAAGLYRNLGAIEPPRLRDVMKWNFRLGPREAPKVDPALVPPGGAPAVAVDRARIAHPDPARVQLTWIGHSTWLIQAGGCNVLTDPIFSDHCFTVPWPSLRRRVPPALRPPALPRLDAVLVSHSHYDHCDVPSLRALGAAPHYAIPAGLAPLARSWGAARLTEAEWGDRIVLGELRLTFLPAQHFAARTWYDRMRSLWGGWLIEVAGRRIYFAGDTAWDSFFPELGAWLAPVDVALLPIGAYMPRWFMHRVHAEPADAVRMHRALGARRSLATHWGAFVLTDEPLREPPLLLGRELAAAGVPADEFTVPAVGETVVV